MKNNLADRLETALRDPFIFLPWGKHGYGLTPREHEVGALVAKGMDNPQIAAELEISPNTVGVHIGSITDKIGMSRRDIPKFLIEQIQNMVPAGGN